jgi:predicted transcriptional regulator
MIPVEGHKNLFRDEKTGAIVNNDTFEYSQYIKMKNEKKKQREEIEKIKDDINEIKSLLKEFINGTYKN